MTYLTLVAACIISLYGVLGMLIAPFCIKGMINCLCVKEQASKEFTRVLMSICILACVVTSFLIYSEKRPCVVFTGMLAEILTIICSASVGTALFEAIWLVAYAIIYIFNKLKKRFYYNKMFRVYIK